MMLHILFLVILNNQAEMVQNFARQVQLPKTHIETQKDFSNRNFFLLSAQILSHGVFNGLNRTEQINVRAPLLYTQYLV